MELSRLPPPIGITGTTRLQFARLAPPFPRPARQPPLPASCSLHGSPRACGHTTQPAANIATHQLATAPPAQPQPPVMAGSTALVNLPDGGPGAQPAVAPRGAPSSIRPNAVRHARARARPPRRPACTCTRTCAERVLKRKALVLHVKGKTPSLPRRARGAREGTTPRNFPSKFIPDQRLNDPPVLGGPAARAPWHW